MCVGSNYLYVPFFDNDAANWLRLTANSSGKMQHFSRKINDEFPLQMQKNLAWIEHISAVAVSSPSQLYCKCYLYLV